MDTYTDPAVRTAIQENAVANEAYRRGNARELVETMLSGTDPEDYDTELLIEALLESDPYEREFADIDAAGFWRMADRHRL